MRISGRNSLWVALLCGSVLPVLAGDDDNMQFIRSPSDNIHCVFYSDPIGEAQCEIAELNPSPDLPAKPMDCDLDYGHRFGIQEAGAPSMICYGDTLRSPGSQILEYGNSATYYGITCSSEKSGLTCKNANGRGFFLSRNRQELF